MRMFHDSLSEKDRRRYAAIEAVKLGMGASSMSPCPGRDPKTIRQGRHDLDQLRTSLASGSVKKGRAEAVHRHHPAVGGELPASAPGSHGGYPMRQEVRWTDLTYEQIADHLAEAGTPVSVPVVKQLLRKHGYVTRKAQKSKTMRTHPDRNQQFENIARLKQEYMGSDNPIVSMDTKKKELIGNFYRAGHLRPRGSSGRSTTTSPASPWA